MTHKGDGYPAFSVSLIPQQLPAPIGARPMRWGHQVVTAVGGRGEKGVGGVKGRIRGFILFSVITANLRICCLFEQSESRRWVVFTSQVRGDNCASVTAGAAVGV